MDAPITSTGNPTVKRLVRLAKRSERRASGRFLVEGSRAVDGFLAAGWAPQGLYLRDDLAAPPAWHERPIQLMAAHVIDRISSHHSASGYIAEFAIPEPAALDPAAGGVVCAELADPGNVGTLLRSAAAFGLSQVYLLGGVDPFAPKVVQSSAGALASLRLAWGPDIAPVLAGAPLVALVASEGLGPESLPAGPTWLVVGSEAHGITPDLQARCDLRLTLPMPGGTESLNAGVAGSIGCFLAAGLHRAAAS
ncbi:MAG: RNA methyltransferase [Planctomycetota bacterium]|jgi:TrmH family RNA methyltransferase|nr:RNA methyltransferase [Planctomycetota bacterium]